MNTILSDTYLKLWQSQKLCDLVIIVGNTQFFAHKIVILSYCKRFRPEILATQPKDLVEIELFRSTREGIQLVLEFIYKSELNLNEDNFTHVYVTSHELQIDFFKEECEKFIKGLIQTSKFKPILSALSCLSHLKQENVYTMILSFLAENLNAVFECAYFFELNYKCVKSLITQSNIKISQEIDILKSLIKWFEYDRKSRSTTLHRLIEHIKFQYIKPEDIETYVEPFEFLMSDQKMKEKIMNSIKYHALKKSSCEWLKDIKTETPRNYTESFEKSRNEPDDLKLTQDEHDENVPKKLEEKVEDVEQTLVVSRRDSSVAWDQNDKALEDIAIEPNELTKVTELKEMDQSQERTFDDVETCEQDNHLVTNVVVGDESSNISYLTDTEELKKFEEKCTELKLTIKHLKEIYLNNNDDNKNQKSIFLDEFGLN